MADAETWAAVDGYEGYYEVSTHGRVRSVERLVMGRPGRMRRMPGRILTPYLSLGYGRVDLSKEGVVRHRKVHQLVASAFAPGWKPGLMALHNDGNAQNNRASNLRWGTSSENILDAVKHGVHIHARKTHCLRGHPFEGDNVTIYKGGRVCMTCRREHTRRSHERTRGQAKGEM